MNQINGSCLCGAVSFHYAPPSLWSAHCHCTMCQRAHGAAFVTWVGVDEQKIKISGEKSLKWFASSTDAQRGFCDQCGSTLFFRARQWAGEIHVARANIESTVDIPPSCHAFWQTHVNWYDFKDSLERK